MYTPFAGALAVPSGETCQSRSFVRLCAAGLRVDLLAGPAEPNGLVSHLEMSWRRVDGVVVGGRGSFGAVGGKGEG